MDQLMIQLFFNGQPHGTRLQVAIETFVVLSFTSNAAQSYVHGHLYDN